MYLTRVSHVVYYRLIFLPSRPTLLPFLQTLQYRYILMNMTMSQGLNIFSDYLFHNIQHFAQDTLKQDLTWHSPTQSSWRTPYIVTSVHPPLTFQPCLVKKKENKKFTGTRRCWLLAEPRGRKRRREDTELIDCYTVHLEKIFYYICSAPSLPKNIFEVGFYCDERNSTFNKMKPQRRNSVQF